MGVGLTLLVHVVEQFIQIFLTCSLQLFLPTTFSPLSKSSDSFQGVHAYKTKYGKTNKLKIVSWPGTVDKYYGGGLDYVSIFKNC